MSIQLITFDLDDTLWDTAPVIVSAEAVLREWLTEHAPNLGAVPVEHLWAIRERILSSEPGLKHRISALRRRLKEQASELGEALHPLIVSARSQSLVFRDLSDRAG